MACLDESFQDFVLTGVSSPLSKELGRRAYGRVYSVKCCETICAAKEIHSILIEDVGEAERRQTTQSFLKECQQCSMLRHPNVIQLLGVYYPPEVGRANRIQLPVMVMEMMAGSLTTFVDKYEETPVHIKYSIIHDVSLGLCYLHFHDPPIVHRDLSPNNVLLTAHHVAKISDLRVAKVIKADSRKTMTKVPGTVDFMPPESLASTPIYGPSMDIFSFAGIILHTFNQQRPTPSDQIQFDPKTRRRVALSEVERRHQYLDKMIGEAEVLRPLVEECLDDDPAVRPAIATVCESIQVNKDTYMKESQDVVILHHELKKKENEIEELNGDVEQLTNHAGQLVDNNKRLSSENMQQMATIGQLTATIEQQVTTIEQQTATIEQQRGTIKRQTATIKQQTATIDHQTAIIEHQTATIGQQTSTIEQQTDAIKQQTVTIKQRTDAIKQQTDAPLK